MSSNPRLRAGRQGVMTTSRSGDRLHASENTAASTLRSKASRQGLGHERKRSALTDKTNVQQQVKHGQHGNVSEKATLKHKVPSSNSQSSQIPKSNSTSLSASSSLQQRQIVTKQRPLSAAEPTSSASVNVSLNSATLVASNSYNGHTHTRGASSSSGVNIAKQHGANDIAMANVEGQLASSSHQSSFQSQGTIAYRQGGSRRAMQLIDQSAEEASSSSGRELDVNSKLRPSEHQFGPHSPNTSGDEDMSETGSEWRSSDNEAAISSKTGTDDDVDVAVRKAAGSTLASSDDELLDGDEDADEDDMSDSDTSALHGHDLDPERLLSLPPEIDELARDKAAQIAYQYKETVLKAAADHAAAERQGRLDRGEIDEIQAAYEDELCRSGLDPEEVRDPSMVAEYANEIFEYMGKCEKMTMANPNYMDFQGEIKWHMRATLVDWLMQVHLRYSMMPETLWIAVNLIDRFLSARVVSLAKLQLVGVTAMFMAAKYEEIIAPSVSEFVFMTENGYTREEILKGERIILSTLDFNVSGYCSPYSWLRKISKADEYDAQTRTLAKFLMELTLFDHRFLRALPSTVAAISMYLSKKMLGGTWHAAFVYYSGLVEEQLIPGANLILERLLDDSFKDCFVIKKYSGRKFLKAALFARDWASRNQESMLSASASMSSNISAAGGETTLVNSTLAAYGQQAAVY